MYSKTQVGWTIIITIGVSAVFIGFLGFYLDQIIAILISGICIITLILFATLKVVVDDERIILYFGPGLIRMTFRLGDIESCRAVKNKWWYGWGIHRMPVGWVYNVSGFDAVEITMKNGKKNRIGTDEPEKLAEVISSRIGSKPV